MRETLLIEDDRVLQEFIGQHLQEIGHNVESVGSWGDARQYLTCHEPRLVILDCKLPDVDGHEVIPELASHQPVIVLTAYGSVPNAVRAIKAGASEYLTKPISLDALEIAVERTLENAALRQEHQFFREQMQALQERKLVGQSEAVRGLYRLIEAVAPSDMTVLIQGESGVGKELVAHEIHRRSPRADHNYVALNCSTLPQTLFESELYGHERGAFTGADRRKQGLIESAEGGTLFLDEIGDLDISAQAKLLRFLETGHFRRVGGTADLISNVRVVAATNRDLEAMTRAAAATVGAHGAGGVDATFRSDLYFRLSTFIIHVPPLRERREDIPVLVEHFVLNHNFAPRVGKQLSRDAMKQLVSYDWPGNVRELRNVIERAIILSGKDTRIGAEHLAFGRRETSADLGLSLQFSNEPTLKDIEREYLTMTLKKYSGHRERVASVLGISVRNLYRLIRKHGLR